MKLFLGHIDELKEQCDFIINLNIKNYGVNEQGCFNYFILNDMITNYFNIEVINIDIDYLNYKTIYNQTIKILSKFKIPKNKIKKAYMYARLKQAKYRKEKVIENTNKLYTNSKKILIAGHSYNIHDNYIMNKIIMYLNQNNYEIIYSDYFDNEKIKNESKKIINNLNFKKNKEYIGAIKLCEEYVDYIIIISVGLCSNDVFINDYIKSKINKPVLNLIIDNNADICDKIKNFIDKN
jgi:hypothetical protein